MRRSLSSTAHSRPRAVEPRFGGIISAEAAIDRRALRNRLIAERRALGEDLHRDHSGRITAHLLNALAAVGPGVLAFYWPHRREYDPRPIAEQVIAAGGAAVLPVVEAGRALTFRQWHPDIQMMVGLYEIPHPAGERELAPDVILVPLVGFDAAGYRLGYGGGYYDRTIAAFAERPTTIGIGFELGRLPSIAPQPHDIPMDMIVTERGVFRPGDPAPA